MSGDERPLSREEIESIIRQQLTGQQLALQREQNVLLDKLARQFEGAAALLRALSGLSPQELRAGAVQVRLQCPSCGQVAQAKIQASTGLPCKITCTQCGNVVYYP